MLKCLLYISSRSHSTTKILLFLEITDLSIRRSFRILSCFIFYGLFLSKINLDDDDDDDDDNLPNS